jgi:FtsH-binding integral membrane protein
MVCALGMYVNQTFIVSGFFMNLISIGLSIYLIFQIANRQNSEDWRMGCLAGLAFQMGYLVGPAMHMIVNVYPELVLQAVLYTATAFTSFSLISLCSKRRSFLFIGGIIASLI